MSQTCRRCGAVFEELQDGGCPACGRRPSPGAAGGEFSRPPIASSAGGGWIWGLVGLAALGALAGGWVLLRPAPPPPPAQAPVPKARTTLKDWEASIPPARFIPTMEALRGVLDQAEKTPPLELDRALDRVVSGTSQTEGKVMVLSALRGRKGRAAAGALTFLARRHVAFQHDGTVEELGHLQAVTIRAVLPYAADAAADVRRACALNLRYLSDRLADRNGKLLWEMEAGQKAAVREACLRLRQDPDEETRQSAEKALEHLDAK